MRGIKLGFVEHPAGDMMLVDFWVKFQDEKLASPSFGQSKWAGHESKYWNWTNCATLKLAGLFFSIKPAIVFKLSRISVQNVIQKFRLCNFLWQTPSVLWCEVVWLKATPPPSWGLCTVHWTYITFIRRNRRTLPSCTKHWFSPRFSPFFSFCLKRFALISALQTSRDS